MRQVLSWEKNFMTHKGTGDANVSDLLDCAGVYRFAHQTARAGIRVRRLSSANLISNEDWKCGGWLRLDRRVKTRGRGPRGGCRAGLLGRGPQAHGGRQGGASSAPT